MARSPTTPPAFRGDDIATALLDALGERDRDSRDQSIRRAADEVDPDQLVGAIADPVNAVRRNAAMDALAKGGRRSVPSLVRVLDSSDDELVMFSAGTLARSRDRSVIPHLVRLLGHRDANVVQTAIDGLGFLRAKDAVVPLLGLLEREPWVRVGAAQALGEIGDVRAVEPLAKLLDDEDTWMIAAEALGKLRSLRAIAYLSDALFRANDLDFDVPLRALARAVCRSIDASLLGEVDPWMRLKRREARSIHNRLATALAQLGATSDAIEIAEAAAVVVHALGLDALYPALLRSARQPGMMESAQLWTLATGGSAASAIAECLGDPAPAVRALACRCAGALHLRAVASRVVDALRDPEPGVRAAAAGALAQIAAHDAAPAIAELLLDPSKDVAAAAGRALHGLDPASASAALLALPRDNPVVIAAMLRAMGARPHAHQLPFILDALDHADAAVRCLAVEALTAQRSIEPIDALMARLGDSDPEVRRAAIRALSASRSARARDALIGRLASDVECSADLVEGLLAAEGDTIVARLVDLFRREPRARRANLVDTLGHRGGAAVEPMVLDLMASNDVTDRRIGVRALARAPSPAMRRILLDFATDVAWEVRLDVAEQLGQSTDERVLHELERLSLDEHPLVARVARHQLERSRGE
ncbi:MAG TPA: HEAT repeat domain-containing protein [Kofleriaceae bacterium]|nr:HEAT repeat domain-containing protein [Kofleriaceae bacterium]